MNYAMLGGFSTPPSLGRSIQLNFSNQNLMHLTIHMLQCCKDDSLLSVQPYLIVLVGKIVSCRDSLSLKKTPIKELLINDMTGLIWITMYQPFSQIPPLGTYVKTTVKFKKNAISKGQWATLGIWDLRVCSGDEVTFHRLSVIWQQIRREQGC